MRVRTRFLRHLLVAAVVGAASVAGFIALSAAPDVRANGEDPMILCLVKTVTPDLAVVAPPETFMFVGLPSDGLPVTASLAGDSSVCGVTVDPLSAVFEMDITGITAETTVAESHSSVPFAATSIGCEGLSVGFPLDVWLSGPQSIGSIFGVPQLSPPQVTFQAGLLPLLTPDVLAVCQFVNDVAPPSDEPVLVCIAKVFGPNITAAMTADTNTSNGNPTFDLVIDMQTVASADPTGASTQDCETDNPNATLFAEFTAPADTTFGVVENLDDGPVALIDADCGDGSTLDGDKVVVDGGAPGGSTVYCTFTNDAVAVCVSKQVREAARSHMHLPNSFEILLDTAGQTQQAATAPGDAGPCPVSSQDVGWVTFLVAPGAEFTISEADRPDVGMTEGRCDRGTVFVFDRDGGELTATAPSEGMIKCGIANDGIIVCVAKEVRETAYANGFTPGQFPITLTVDGFPNEALTQVPGDPTLYCGEGAGEPDESIGWAEFLVAPGATFTVGEELPSDDVGPVQEPECATKALEPLARVTNGETLSTSVIDYPAPFEGRVDCWFVNDSVRVCVAKHVGETALDAGFRADQFMFEISVADATPFALVLPDGEPQLSPRRSPGCVRECGPQPDLFVGGPGFDECQMDDPCGGMQTCLSADVQPPGMGDPAGRRVGFVEFLVAPGADFTVTEINGSSDDRIGPIFARCVQPDARAPKMLAIDEDDGEVIATASGHAYGDAGPVFCRFVNDSVRVCVSKEVARTARDAGFRAKDFSFDVTVRDRPARLNVRTDDDSQLSSRPSEGCRPDCRVVPTFQGDPGNERGCPSDCEVMVPLAAGLSDAGGGGACEPPCDMVNFGAGDGGCESDPCAGAVQACASESVRPGGYGKYGYVEFFVAPRDRFTVTELIDDGWPVGPVFSDCYQPGAGMPRVTELGPNDGMNEGQGDPGTVRARARARSGPVFCHFVNDSVRVCVSKEVGDNGLAAGYVAADFTFALTAHDSPVLNAAVYGEDGQLHPYPTQPCGGPDPCAVQFMSANAMPGNHGGDEPCEPWSCDDDATPGESFDNAWCNAAVGYTEFFVAPGGSFTVSEMFDADAAIGPINSACFQRSNKVEPGSMEPDSPGSASWHVDPHAERLVYCEFFNDSVKLIVNKQIVLDDGGTAVVGDFTFDVFAASGAALGSGSDADPGEVGYVLYVAPAQTITVTERDVDGYSLSEADCAVDDEEEDEFQAIVASSVEIELPREAVDVNCLFVNDDNPRVIICGVQILESGGSSFTLNDLALELFDSGGALLASVNSASNGDQACTPGTANLVGSANALAASQTILLTLVPNDGQSMSFVQRAAPDRGGYSLQAVSHDCVQYGATSTPVVSSGSPARFTLQPGTTRVICTAVAQAFPNPRFGSDSSAPVPEPSTVTNVSVPADAAGSLVADQSLSALAITGGSPEPLGTLALSLFAAGTAALALGARTRRRRYLTGHRKRLSCR